MKAKYMATFVKLFYACRFQDAMSSYVAANDGHGDITEFYIFQFGIKDKKINEVENYDEANGTMLAGTNDCSNTDPS